MKQLNEEQVRYYNGLLKKYMNKRPIELLLEITDMNIGQIIDIHDDLWELNRFMTGCVIEATEKEKIYIENIEKEVASTLLNRLKGFYRAKNDQI